MGAAHLVAPEIDSTTICHLSDSFETAGGPGSVVGAHTSDGIVRKGVDLEQVISSDNGALRIQPLLAPGWARAGIAYGPFQRSNGLAFAVFMLNGHNTAQSENLSESFRARITRWLVGPEVFRSRQRLVQWLRSRRKRRMLRQWRWWWRTSKHSNPVPRIDENLALGWFGAKVPVDPLGEGNGMVMHATGHENGELWVRVGDTMLAAARGVQNLQVYYVVVLRERGAAYYSASVPGANGLGSYPGLRPLGIDPFNIEAEVHAGLFQSTLGQIGFRLDTRVYGTRIARIGQWSPWYGTAHAADLLYGIGVLGNSAAEVGGAWIQPGNSLERTSSGVQACRGTGYAVLQPETPSGLLHVLIECNECQEHAAGLLWRYLDAENYWQLRFGADGCQLAVCEHGHWSVLAHDRSIRLAPNSTHSVQVLDDGGRISLHLDGSLLFETRFDDRRLQAATGVGVSFPELGGGSRLSRFEAHPRCCRLPEALDMGAPWWRVGTECVVTEGFEGPQCDLAGKQTTTGGMTWSRTLGMGHIDVMGNGIAKVRADSTRPNPGRTGYTVEWRHPDFADLEVEITPAGSVRGQGNEGRAGLLFWQDDSNFILVNNWLNDGYGGASVSCFSCLGGFEDLYDAVWSNVGARISWGKAHRFRVVFDGMHILALVDDEPILYRAVTDVYADATRLQINRIGLLANWEWGNDTGSSFRSFRARI